MVWWNSKLNSKFSTNFHFLVSIFIKTWILNANILSFSLKCRVSLYFEKGKSMKFTFYMRTYRFLLLLNKRFERVFILTLFCFLIFAFHGHLHALLIKHIDKYFKLKSSNGFLKITKLIYWRFIQYFLWHIQFWYWLSYSDIETCAFYLNNKTYEIQ